MRLRKGQTVFLVALAIIVVIALAYAALHVAKTYPKRAKLLGKPLPVEFSKAEVREMVETVGATTIAAPFHEVNLKSDISGTVKEIPVKLGEVVTPTTLVVRLEDREYQTACRQAQAAVKSAAEQVKTTRLTQDRYSVLYREKLIPLAELEKYQLAYVQAKATLAQAQRDLAFAQRHLAATQLKSPIFGVLTSQQAHVGEYVPPNAPLVSLGQITPILANALVPEEKLLSVSLGQKAVVSFDAFPGQVFEGLVYKIDPTIDKESRVFKTYVELPNADQKLRPGLTGYTRMERTVRGLAIPSIGVIDAFKQPMVFVVKDGVASLRKITPGGLVGSYTLVKEGLMEGDEVVVAGQRFLKEGDRVQSGRQ